MDKKVFFSDLHRGDGSAADSFAHNKHVYKHALKHYFKSGFELHEAGDADELFKFSLREIIYAHRDVFDILDMFYKENRYVRYAGNHDPKKTLLNEFRKERIFSFLEVKDYGYCCISTFDSIRVEHGHKGSWIDDKLSWLGKFFVRYIWRPINTLGLSDPTKPVGSLKRSSKFDKKFYKRAEKTGNIYIVGHTHRPVFEGAKKGEESKQVHYYNIGSGVHPRCITAIELDDITISLVKWYYDVNSSGVLCVKKKVLKKGILT